MLCQKVHLSLVSTKFHVVQKRRLLHLSWQLEEEEKKWAKEKKNQILSYDSKIIHFFKCIKTQKKIDTYPTTTR
jgi:hypothetical protein